MIFSWVLIVFGILHVIYTLVSNFFHKAKINKDLRYIKQHDIQKIVEDCWLQCIENDGKEQTKQEIESLLKNIYFNLYNQHKNTQEIENNYSDIERSIDNVLNNNILTLMEEKDKLLQEKDQTITLLEEKNEKFINDTIAKINYIIDGKDKLLNEKDKIIYMLYQKTQNKKVETKEPEVIIQHTTEPKKTQDMEPNKRDHTYHYSENFINVN